MAYICIFVAVRAHATSPHRVTTLSPSLSKPWARACCPLVVKHARKTVVHGAGERERLFQRCSLPKSSLSRMRPAGERAVWRRAAVAAASARGADLSPGNARRHPRLHAAPAAVRRPRANPRASRGRRRRRSRPRRRNARRRRGSRERRAPGGTAAQGSAKRSEPSCRGAAVAGVAGLHLSSQPPHDSIPLKISLFCAPKTHANSHCTQFVS
jgi:hypothetical protein